MKIFRVYISDNISLKSFIDKCVGNTVKLLMLKSDQDDSFSSESSNYVSQSINSIMLHDYFILSFACRVVITRTIAE